jgi:hypothetical protein
MKKKRLGLAGEQVLKSSGAAALAAVMEGESDDVDPMHESTASVPSREPEKVNDADPMNETGPKTARRQGLDLVQTTVGVRRDQWIALKQSALERSIRNGGKPDASGILRQLIDAWMDGRISV